MDSPDHERGYSPGRSRKVWLHLASSTDSPSGTLEFDKERKRPPYLNGPLDIEDRTPDSNLAGRSHSRFSFISPVEPVVSLARFHGSSNKVYIPIDEDAELEIGEEGFASLNNIRSNFALLGTPGSSLLASGSFGKVYKAIHFPTMRRVAIKKIPRDFEKSHEFSNSFARELRNLYKNLRELREESAASLSARTRAMNDEDPGTDAHCPYLLTLYDAYIEREPTILCLVLEFMENGSLETLMKQHPAGLQDGDFLREIAHNILQEPATAGSVISPSSGFHTPGREARFGGNIMLTATRFAKLGDFGLTMSAASREGERAVGTAPYWPPELWGIEKYRDPNGRGDIWSLGLTLLAVATGKSPLDGCTLRSQAEIELSEAWREAKMKNQTSLAAAETRGCFCVDQFRTSRQLSPVLKDFVFRCLADLPRRPGSTELLTHDLIEDYYARAGRKRRELEEAVKALTTHIEIHKEWKITPRMIELLAKELRIDVTDLQDYLSDHVDPALYSTQFSNSRESSEVCDQRQTSPATPDEDDSLGQSINRSLLTHYDEIDRLRTIVIPSLEETICSLRKEVGQLRQRNADLTHAQKCMGAPRSVRSKVAEAAAELSHT